MRNKSKTTSDILDCQRHCCDFLGLQQRCNRKVRSQETIRLR